MLVPTAGTQQVLCEYLLSQYKTVVSPEPSSVHVSPVATVKEFTSPKHTAENFPVRRSAVLRCASLPSYTLASYAFWSGRFAGLNVEPSCLRQKYPQCVSSWYPLTFWYRICFIFLETFCSNIYFAQGKKLECLCKIRLVFIYDGFSHSEKSTIWQKWGLPLTTHVKCACKQAWHSQRNTGA